MPRTQVRANQISDELTDADFAAANKDGAAGTPSLRTLGTGAQQAAAGNHTHTEYAALAAANTFTHGQIIQAASGEVGLDVRAPANANALNIRDSGGTIRFSFDKDGYGGIHTPTFLLAIGGAITTGTNKTNRVIVPRAGKIVKAWIDAKTGPTGADLVVDVNLNGTSIWATTQANRLKIAAGGTGGTQTSFDTTAVAEGDALTIDVDQVGSTVAGQDVTVHLLLLLRNQG